VAGVRLHYFMEPQYQPRPLRAWGRLVQHVLDTHPGFGERFLSYWVGGIEELRVTLLAVKPSGGEA
jgi:hypothetical protein